MTPKLSRMFNEEMPPYAAFARHLQHGFRVPDLLGFGETGRQKTLRPRPSLWSRLSLWSSDFLLNHQKVQTRSNGRWTAIRHDQELPEDGSWPLICKVKRRHEALTAAGSTPGSRSQRGRDEMGAPSRLPRLPLVGYSRREGLCLPYPPLLADSCYLRLDNP